jgi:hypothetical protein
MRNPEMKKKIIKNYFFFFFFFFFPHEIFHQVAEICEADLQVEQILSFVFF